MVTTARLLAGGSRDRSSAVPPKMFATTAVGTDGAVLTMSVDQGTPEVAAMTAQRR
jgi:hypothetical protein